MEKHNPLWSQFVERKSEFIGKVLEDFGDNMDRGILNLEKMTTKITDIILIPNGSDSAWFEIKGEDFSCGFDVSVGGIGSGEKGYLTFCGYGGHKFRISTN